MDGILAELPGHVTWAGYAGILIAAALGALVQGSIGFGAAMVAVPVVALVAPEALPATVIIWAIPMTAAMAFREHRGVDWQGVGWIAVGRFPGTILGTWVVTAVTARTLSVLSGGAVLAAVFTSLLAASVPLTRGTKALAGFTSGVMGTATSIGGPPLALLYQHQEGLVLRSTLAASFFVGTITSLVMLIAVGVVQTWHVVLALALLPGLACGLALSRPLAHYLDDRWLRPAVLVLTSTTALVAIVHGIAG